jgi:hypothetical protein
MKNILALTIFCLPAIGFSSENSVKKTIASTLNAKSLMQLIDPMKIDGEIYTPYAAWYIKAEDISPSCTLINKEDFSKTLEMMAPSDGQFGNCHQALQKPTISSFGGNYYATYTYVSEETRAEFNTEYQIVKLDKRGFSQCKEEPALLKDIHKQLQKKKIYLSIAVQEAIRKIGCTSTLN